AWRTVTSKVAQPSLVIGQLIASRLERRVVRPAPAYRAAVDRFVAGSTRPFDHRGIKLTK
ncbi:MAG: hypothetical protein WKH68_08480, partial [Candidatus Limnocylindria bacterium]